MTVSMAELENLLSNCIGTEQYHRVSPFLRVCVTDGVKLWAEKCEAFWALDLIAFGLSKLTRREENSFLVVTIECNKNHSCKFQAVQDTDMPPIWKKTQKNYDASMPVGTHKFYLIDDVLLLPQEY